MSTRAQKLQYMMRRYKEETGKREIDMHDLAAWMIHQGWREPKPPTPVDILAQELSRAAREEIRHDKEGHPYRANHAAPTYSPTGQVRMFWFDIDERPPRKKMLKSLQLRRNQMIGDGLQLSRDADHWNDLMPQDEPIQMVFDLTDDIAERKASLDEDEESA